MPQYQPDVGYKTVAKPGIMGRAVTAWFVLNLIMVVTLAIIVYLVNPWMNNWYIALPLMVACVITEWIITTDTIAPFVRKWIAGEETVKDGELPSWEKGK